MAVTWLRRVVNRLVIAKVQFRLGPVRVRILVELWAQRQVCPSSLDFLCMLCATISSIYHRRYRATV
jgi:5-carboxymethyl-2-hydroxymuconate isomerase